MRVILSLILLLALAAISHAEILQLVISNETVPAGGVAQIKIRAAEPRRISSGWLRLKFDRRYFAEIRRVVSYSVSGDAMGYGQVWDYDPNNVFVAIRLASPSAGIGQLPDLPIVAITASLRQDIPSVTKTPITAEEVQASDSLFNNVVIGWTDSSGVPFETTATAGSIQVGGTLSISDVQPGGGTLPAGSIIAITGSGFDLSTTVTIDGLSFDYAQRTLDRIELRLTSSAELTGRRVRVTNASGETTDVYASLPTRPSDAAVADTHVFLPLTARKNGQAGTSVVEATQVLQNPGSIPVEVTWQGRDRSRRPVYGKTTILPGDQTRVVPQEVDATVFFANGPVRSAVYNQFYRPAIRDWVTVPDPATAFSTLQLNYVSASLTWTFQKGARTSEPRYISIGGSGKVRITKQADAAWLQLEPGTDIIDLSLTTSIRATVKTDGLEPGTYTANIGITPITPDGIPNVPVKSETVQAILRITSGPELSVAGAFFFRQLPDKSISPVSGPVYVLSNGDPIPFTVHVENADWLTVTPSETTAPATLTLSATPGNRAPGLYKATLVVQSATQKVTSEVTLSVQSAQQLNTLQPSMSRVVVTTAEGSTAMAQTIYVLHQGKPAARVEYVDSSGWLTVEPIPLLVDAGFTLQFETKSLTPGTYRASIVLTEDGYAPGTISVVVAVLPAVTKTTLQASLDRLTFVTPAGTPSEPQRVTTSVPQGTEYGRVNPPGLAGVVVLNYPFDSYAMLDTDSFARYATPFSATAVALATSPGTYNGAFEFLGYNSTVRIPWTAYITASGWSPPTLANFVSAASQLPVPLVPGGIYSLHGLGIGGAKNTDVRIAGISATVMYSAPD